jgi:hypothetical protein
MNAVTIGIYEFDESELMPINEKDDLQIQVAKLETNVQHIQSDVSDIKTDLRATNQRIDALSEKVDKRFDAMKEETNERFGKLETQVSGILLRLESWKVWALGLFAAQSGTLLWIMAKGFKWF